MDFLSKNDLKVLDVGLFILETLVIAEDLDEELIEGIDITEQNIEQLRTVFKKVLERREKKEQTKKYFIEYNEDMVLPRCADADLIAGYRNYIGPDLVPVFDTEVQLLRAVAEVAQFARNGVDTLKEYTRDEMLKLLAL